MSAKPHSREQLIAQLAWQIAAGADEALLDTPNPDAEVKKIDEFVLIGGKNTLNSTLQKSADNPAPTAQPVPAAITKSPHVNPPQASSPQIGPNPDDIKTLTALRGGLEKMDECALKHTASNMVFADGNPGSRVMIVGEAPGRDEDRVGLPFVGASGQLLDKMLASIGLDRSTVYIANLLPWRPPGNRTPTAEETAMLLPWLRKHIQLANPEFVFILGGSSAKALLNSKDGIMKVRGKWQAIDYGDGIERPTLASLHPAYLLRSPAQKRLAYSDLLSLAAKL